MMAAVAVLNLVFWPLWIAIEGGMTLQAGYFAWAGSFACAATALWLRARQWGTTSVWPAGTGRTESVPGTGTTL